MTKKLPKWAKVLLTVLIVVIGVKVAWGIAYPSGTWRYKLTVEVDTPEGVKTGTVVREVAGSYRTRFMGASLAISMGHSKSEAVVIDLGRRGVLFGLNKSVTGADGHFVVPHTFPPPKGISGADSIRYLINLEAGPATVKPADYPMFVRFHDLTDPKTVEHLLQFEPCPPPNPYPKKYCQTQDRFAEAFGEGVALKSVTIEMTRDPVTTGVVGKYMPSYKKDYEGFMKWFRSLPYEDPRQIGPDAFGSWGEK